MDIEKAVKDSAAIFDLDEAWFDTQSHLQSLVQRTLQRQPLCIWVDGNRFQQK